MKNNEWKIGSFSLYPIHHRLKLQFVWLRSFHPYVIVHLSRPNDPPFQIQNINLQRIPNLTLFYYRNISIYLIVFIQKKYSFFLLHRRKISDKKFVFSKNKTIIVYRETKIYLDLNNSDCCTLLIDVP